MPASMEDVLASLAKDMERLRKEPVGSRRIKISDLTPREGQQTKLATRVSTDDLLPLCEKLDKCGFYAVEMWGGATFDTCIRYLKEDPWERLRRIKQVMPNTKLQMLLRGQHILAYRPYSDKLVRKFVEKAVENGMNVFRIFEATNDFRNIEVATRAVRELGGEAHIEVNYTVSPVHTFERWMEYAEQLMEIEANWLSLKDATGILMPFDAYRLIRGIKERTKGRLPVLLHCHDMGGTSIANHMMAILAGVDMVDTVMTPLAFGASHPGTESMVAALKNTPFDTGIDPTFLEEPAAIARQIREKYEKYSTEYTGVSGEVLIHKIPGGMISNMVAQLKEAGKPDLMNQALLEAPNVERDLGYPPLLTPCSQIVGVQAVLNVVAGERYKVITRETKDYVMGKYGRPPGPIGRELMRKIMGDREPDYSMRAGQLADPEDWDKTVKEFGSLAKSEEDLLLCALFPMQAREFLVLREKGELHPEKIEAKPPERVEVKTEPAAPLPAPGEFEVGVYPGDKFRVHVAGVTERVPGGPRVYFIKMGGKLWEVEVNPMTGLTPSAVSVSSATSSVASVPPVRTTNQSVQALIATPPPTKTDLQPGDVVAPLAGKIVRVLVGPGDKVKRGQTAVVVEAMKMENEIQSPMDGVVERIFVKPGDNVTTKDALLRVVPK
ncbi:MAG: pyruvate carboxylase subunit B [Candidatus Bathyarchaeia archaeon]